MAQLNIALPLEPLTSDRLAGFVEILEPVNALADRCPGFVWRLQTEDGDATAVRGFGDDRLIVNLTVWTSLEALGAYVHGGFHADVMRRREWVTRLREAYTALWWVPADVRPTVGDAELRLAALRERGPTPYAFTVKRPFAAPGSVVEQSSDDDWVLPGLRLRWPCTDRARHGWEAPVVHSRAAGARGGQSYSGPTAPVSTSPARS